jgi:hypothetical protein
MSGYIISLTRSIQHRSQTHTQVDVKYVSMSSIYIYIYIYTKICIYSCWRMRNYDYSIFNAFACYLHKRSWYMLNSMNNQALMVNIHNSTIRCYHVRLGVILGLWCNFFILVPSWICYHNKCHSIFFPSFKNLQLKRSV